MYLLNKYIKCKFRG